MAIWLPEIDDLRPDQRRYLEHLVRSWWGWVPGETAFIMPTRLQRVHLLGRLRKAYRTTVTNRP